MRNYVQEGESIQVAAPYAVSSGDGVQVGTALFGVAATTAASGADVVIKTNGVFDVKAKSTDTPAIGAKLYWDNTNKEITTTATSNLLCGIALVAKASGDTTVRMILVLGM